MSSETLHFKGKRCSFGKHSKKSITGITASNALGEKIQQRTFVIGKSAKPNCLKHVRNLPSRYRARERGWMDKTIFEEWLRELDRMFERKGRKLIMIADNFPAHPEIIGLKFIDLQFSPPNTTYCTQPMDQGVRRYFFKKILLAHRNRPTLDRRKRFFKQITFYKNKHVTK